MSCSNLIQPLVFGMLQRCLQFVSVSSFQEKIILHTFDVVVFVGGNGGGVCVCTRARVFVLACVRVCVVHNGFCVIGLNSCNFSFKSVVACLVPCQLELL